MLGDRDGTTCEPRFTELVRSTLAGMGYEVKVNDPYKGVELVRAYSDPRAGRHSLQIEINKRLYMDEKTLAKSAGFAHLQKNLGELFERWRMKYRIEIQPPDISAYRKGNSGVEYVHVLDSGKPGPNVMVQALTHGNEFSGAIALDFLFREKVKPRRES